MAHILITDDDALMRRSVSFSLEQAGYRTSTAGSAEDALTIAQRDPPDLMLLDIGLPGMDGLAALRELRKTAEIPVIFVSARRRELDQILGLEMGADDYITKPFDPDILLARIKAVLRRTQRHVPAADEAAKIQVGHDLEIDPAGRTVTIGGQSVALSKREFDLLHALALQAGQVITIEDLLNQVWGAEFFGETQVVYVHIRRLRQKLEIDANHPVHIITVRGVGYKLV